MTDNIIHRTVVIEGDVELGENNYIGANVVLVAPLCIGDNNYIGANTIIGTPPEDATNLDSLTIREFSGTGVLVGNNNVIRELTIIHGSIDKPTSIENRNWIHSQSHIDHDCHLHDDVVLAPMVVLAGRVTVERQAQVGMNATVHQEVTIGAYSMVGMNATVVDNVPPCALVKGTPARLSGVNERKLQILGVDKGIIRSLDEFLKGKGDLPNDLPPFLKREFHALIANRK